MFEIPRVEEVGHIGPVFRISTPLWWLIHLCPTTPTPAYFSHTEATAVRLESQSLVFPFNSGVSCRPRARFGQRCALFLAAFAPL